MKQRICIVHYGEHLPFEEGYRPVRYGQLAEYLTQRGVEVVRVCPSFAFAFQIQRPMEWSGRVSSEGISKLVATRDYPSSRSLRRLGFIRDLNRETARYLESEPPFDLIFVGYPPPGLVRAVRMAVGDDVPIIADIRDLWPDALAPDNAVGRMLHPLLKITGKLLSVELRLATGVIALSSTMLLRAPANKRVGVIPICMPSNSRDLSYLWPSVEDKVQFVFVGSFAPLFDFKSLIEGWRIFQQKKSDVNSAQLRLFGAGQRSKELGRLAEGVPNLSLEGWVNPDKVGECLAASDVGIAPSRSGQGTTMGNKVLEYLDAGLFVVNSLDAEVARFLTDQNLGERVDCNAKSWAVGFLKTCDNIARLRQERKRRQSIARDALGQSASESMWWTLIEDTIRQ